MIWHKIKEEFNKIPSIVRFFLIKAFVVFISWQLVYHLILNPIRFPDKILTNITCYSTAKVLSLYYKDAYAVYSQNKSIIIIGGKKALGIADPCNALEIFVLYIAFLFCYPGNLKTRFKYSIIGIVLIYIANILRCSALTLLNLYDKGWMDISHHYLFTIVLYLLVFSLWVKYCKNVTINES